MQKEKTTKFTEKFISKPPSTVVKFKFEPDLNTPDYSALRRRWIGYDSESNHRWEIFCPYKIGGWVKNVIPVLINGIWHWEVEVKGSDPNSL